MNLRYNRRSSPMAFGSLVAGDAFYYGSNSVLMKMCGAGEQNAVDLDSGETYSINADENVKYICDIEIVIG